MSYAADHIGGDEDVPVLDWPRRIRNIIGQGEEIVDIAEALVEDPYLPETACRVLQLQDLEAGKRPRDCKKEPPGKRGGIGLRRTIGPLRTYVWSVENPALAVAAASAAVGGVFLLGYVFGRA